MKTLHLVPLSLALVVASMTALVGCSAAPVQSFEPNEKGEEQSSSKKKEETKKVED